MKGFNKVCPGVVIAAPQGRSGKTIISLGLCAAFTRRGLVVQPFKKGPDYIDPSWLSVAAGRDCRNLDSVIMPEEAMLSSFQRTSRGADLALVEGAMGLYDSLDVEGYGSTAGLARLLHLPIILVINTTRMTRSVAAMVAGYQQFEPETRIAGVILNNVSGSRHEHKLRTAIELHCGIPVLGSIPRDDTLSISERHLGLIPSGEAQDSAFVIDRIHSLLKERFDLDGILDTARSAGSYHITGLEMPEKKASVVRIGVMRDRVFTFYYPENLESLAREGAELVFIDSTQDRNLPDIDGLYIGGGFPELFLGELETNTSLRLDIAVAIENGLPVYAECAGLMYLCRSIKWKGQRHEMVGVIPGEVEIHRKPQGHGYVEVEVTAENPLFPIGLILHGHEFHHSRLSRLTGLNFAYGMRRGHGIDGQVDAIVYKNVFAAYTHLHALGASGWAEALVSLALREQRNQPVCSM